MTSHEVVLHITVCVAYTCFMYMAWNVKWKGWCMTDTQWDWWVKLLLGGLDLAHWIMAVVYVVEGSSARNFLKVYFGYALAMLTAAVGASWAIAGVKFKALASPKEEAEVADKTPASPKEGEYILGYEGEYIMGTAHDPASAVPVTASLATLGSGLFFLIMFGVDVCIEFKVFGNVGAGAHPWNIVSFTTHVMVMLTFLIGFGFVYVNQPFAFVMKNYQPFARVPRLTVADDDASTVSSRDAVSVEEQPLLDVSEPLKKVSSMVMYTFMLLFPVPAIFGLQFVYTSLFLDFFNDYGRVSHFIVVCILFPNLICAFHQTKAAWTDTFIFAFKTFMQCFFMVPAFFRMDTSGKLECAVSEGCAATEVHKFFTTNWNNTALVYRTDYDSDAANTFTIRHAVSIVGISYTVVLAGVVFMGSSMSGDPVNRVLLTNYKKNIKAVARGVVNLPVRVVGRAADVLVNVAQGVTTPGNTARFRSGKGQQVTGPP